MTTSIDCAIVSLSVSQNKLLIIIIISSSSRMMYVCGSCTVGSVQKRHVAIARLRNPAFIGRTCQEVWFIILVVTSTKEARSLALRLSMFVGSVALHGVTVLAVDAVV